MQIHGLSGTYSLPLPSNPPTLNGNDVPATTDKKRKKGRPKKQPPDSPPADDQLTLRSGLKVRTVAVAPLKVIYPVANSAVEPPLHTSGPLLNALPLPLSTHPHSTRGRNQLGGRGQPKPLSYPPQPVAPTNLRPHSPFLTKSPLLLPAQSPALLPALLSRQSPAASPPPSRTPSPLALPSPPRLSPLVPRGDTPDIGTDGTSPLD